MPLSRVSRVVRLRFGQDDKPGRGNKSKVFRFVCLGSRVGSVNIRCGRLCGCRWSSGSLRGTGRPWRGRWLTTSSPLLWPCVTKRWSLTWLLRRPLTVGTRWWESCTTSWPGLCRRAAVCGCACACSCLRACRFVCVARMCGVLCAPYPCLCIAGKSGKTFRGSLGLTSTCPCA